MTRPSVVHVVVAGEVGGAERMLVDLVTGAEHETHAVALATPSERLRDLFRSAGLVIDDRGPVREGPLSYVARSLGPSDAAWLEEILRARGAEIVHLHTFGSQVLGTRAARRVGAKIVRTEHSTRVYDDPSCWPFSRWSLARADAVVAISEHVRSRALERAPWVASRARVVPNGVDTERFAAVPLPAGDEPLRLLALGRLDRRKGLDVAIDAVARVPGVSLTVVGEGEERAALEAHAIARGVRDRVVFEGFADDVRPHVARAHALVSSARSEGLGVALLEGMAMGRAVVALPTGGVPELVRDGETGFLADGRDAAALTRTIERTVRERASLEALGARARAFAVERYDLRVMRAGYTRVYAEVLAGGVSEYPRSGS